MLFRREQALEAAGVVLASQRRATTDPRQIKGTSMTSSFLRRVILGSALALAIAATLGTAESGAFSFQPFYEFTIAFTGHGSYTRTSTSEGPGKLTEEASWQWSTVYPHVLVPTTGSSPLQAAGFPAGGLGQEGKGEWKITNTGEESEDCSNSGTLSLKSNPLGGGGGGVSVHRPPGGFKRGVIFDMVALEGFESLPHGDNVLPCDPSEWWQQTIVGFIGAGSKHANPNLSDVQPLTAKLQLTPSDLKHARVTKQVAISASEKVPSDCGSGNGSVCTDEYTWSGTVKFTKHKLHP